MDFHDPGGSGEFSGSFTPSTGYRVTVGFRHLGWEVVAWDPVMSPEPPPGSVDLVWLHGQRLRRWVSGVRWVWQTMPKHIPLIVNYCDARLEMEWWVPAIAARVDLLLHAAGGDALRQHLAFGYPRVGFAPGPVLEYRRDEVAREVGRDLDWYFSGTASPAFGDGHRDRDLDLAAAQLGPRLYAAGWREPRSGGWRHIQQTHRARKGIAVSHFHDLPKYSSHRTWHYMANGVDIIARDFAGADVMLPCAVPRYSTLDELADLLASHRRSEDRVAILRRWTLRRYHAREIVAGALAYLDGRMPEQDWGEVVNA